MDIMIITLIPACIMFGVCIAFVTKAMLEEQGKQIKKDERDKYFIERVKEEHPEIYKDFIDEEGFEFEEHESNESDDRFWFGFIMGHNMNELFK